MHSRKEKTTKNIEKTSIMKKISTFIMALALVLGLSQCNKQETPATSEAEDDMVYISVKANDGDRDAFYPNTGALVYGNGDKISVGNGSKCLGFLTYNTGAFAGGITRPATGQYLYFYFIGGGHEIPWQQAPGLTSYDFNLSYQLYSLPVVSFGKSTTPYSGSNVTYECVLRNQCALVHFDYTGTRPVIAVGNVPTVVTFDFTDPENGIKPKEGSDNGSITLYRENIGSRWAIMLPGTDLGEAVVENGEIRCYYEDGLPTLGANELYKTGITINDDTSGK